MPLCELPSETVPDMLVVAAAAIRNRSSRHDRHDPQRRKVVRRVVGRVSNSVRGPPRRHAPKVSGGNSIVPSRSRRFMSPANEVNPLVCSSTRDAAGLGSRDAGRVRPATLGTQAAAGGSREVNWPGNGAIAEVRGQANDELQMPNDE